MDAEKKSQNWFSFQANAKDAESVNISIHDEIGAYGVSAKDFLTQFGAIDKKTPIELSIHSGGGDVLDGWAMFDAIRLHEGPVTARVLGLAASMATVIPMAADKIIMPENAWWMIHNPTVGVWGDAKEMEDTSATLRKIEAGIVKAYMNKTGLGEDEIRALMDATTYMDGNEALERGFIDEVDKEFKAAAIVPEWRDKLQTISNTLPKVLVNSIEPEILKPSPPVTAQAPAAETPTKPETEVPKNAMSETQKTPVAPAKSIKDLLAEDKPRREEIKAIGEKFSLKPEAITDAIENGVEIGNFRNSVIDSFDPSAQPQIQVEQLQAMNTVGDKAAEKFSMFKALREVSEGGSPTGLEKEIQDELSKKYHAATGNAPTGMLVPSEWWNQKPSTIQNAATVGTGTSGGNTVDNEFQELTDYLSDYSILPEIGATIFRDATGNLEFPRSTAGYAGSWDAETDAIANADATFASNLVMSPKRVGAGTAVSKKLLVQSSTDFEGWVRIQLQKAIAEAVDRAAITGTGANDQPTGLLAASGTGAYTWLVGSAAWVNIVDQVAVLRAANGDLNNAAWLTDHTVRADWKKTPVVSGASNMIIERGWKPRQSMVDDLPFYDHTDVTTGKAIVGNFSDLMVALWGGIQLTHDPYSLKKSGQIELYAETFADVGVRQPASFVIGNAATTHAGSI